MASVCPFLLDPKENFPQNSLTDLENGQYPFHLLTTCGQQIKQFGDFKINNYAVEGIVGELERVLCHLILK